MGLGNNENVVVDDTDGSGCGVAGVGKSCCGSVSCSICLEVVTDNGDRSWVKLQCGHHFHLDCIGSAFNIKGAMQCPNCRKIEKGQWLYANGCRSFPEFNMDDWTHDEDLYDLSYSEMLFGVHWCPFGSLTRFPLSFDEGEYSSTAYHELLGQHILFAEHAAVSSATNPCPYISYIGPIHSSSSNSIGRVSEASSFNGNWNGTSVPSELQTSYAFPAMDFDYHSWERHLLPFSTAGSRIGGTNQPSILPVTQRPARTSSDMPRSGSFMRPFLFGHSNSSGARALAGNSVNSSMIAPYPGSNARTRDRVQALQAYYQLQQPSNSAAMHTPFVSGTRRSSNDRGLAQLEPVASSTDQSGGFYIFPPGTSGQNFQEAENPLSSRFYLWERDHLSAFSSNQIDRDPSWGAFQQVASGLDPLVSLPSGI